MEAETEAQTLTQAEQVRDDNNIDECLKGGTHILKLF
jgi:hypothetical protein